MCGAVDLEIHQPAPFKSGGKVTLGEECVVMSDTLVLNKNFTAIHIVSWQKSMSLLAQGAAEAVDENLQGYNFNDWCELSSMMEAGPKFIHTTTMRIAVPEVIRLTKYDRLPKRDVKFTRSNIYTHYNNTCCYCGGKFSTKELNLDHVIPRSKGGHTNWTNIVLSCIPCNSRKDDMSPEQAGMKLLVKPSRPIWKGSRTITVQAPLPMPVSWSRLIDDKYWSSELEHN